MSSRRGLTPVERGVLLTDGYTAYEHYTEKTGLTHAQCWAHTRRKLFESRDVEPVALSLIHISEPTRPY